MNTLEHINLSAQDPFREEHMITLPAFAPKIETFPRLLSLDLSVNNLALEGTKMLFLCARDGMFPLLQLLNLERNNIPDAALEDIFLPSNLIEFKLSLNLITGVGMQGMYFGEHIMNCKEVFSYRFTSSDKST